MSCDDFDSSSDYSEDAVESSSVESVDADTDLYESESADSVQEDENAELYDNSQSEDDIELYPENSDYDSADITEDENHSEVEDVSENIDSEIRSEINEKSDYSSEVNDRISSVEELDLYQKAGLKEETIDGRTCLVREDLDYDYIDPKTGKTNLELMEEGRSPYDAKTGERIELHHIGQDPDAPLAELTEDSEHGEYASVLHKSEEESWRKDDPQRNNHYNNVERPNHWMERAKGGQKQ